MIVISWDENMPAVLLEPVHLELYRRLICRRLKNALQVRQNLETDLWAEFCLIYIWGILKSSSLVSPKFR